MHTLSEKLHYPNDKELGDELVHLFGECGLTLQEIALSFEEEIPNILADNFDVMDELSDFLEVNPEISAEAYRTRREKTKAVRNMIIDKRDNFIEEEHETEGVDGELLSAKVKKSAKGYIEAQKLLKDPFLTDAHSSEVRLGAGDGEPKKVYEISEIEVSR